MLCSLQVLAHQDLINTSDRDRILSGLDEVEKNINEENFAWTNDMDVYMNIEATLTDLIGDSAKKLQIARNKNEQVSTDLRMWCREVSDTVIARIEHLQVALVTLAMKNVGLIVPGYTHLQRAQHVLLHRVLLAFVEQLDHDVGRIKNCKDRMNFCPLGACALADTVPLPIDRIMTSNALGFIGPLKNSIDAVSDWDFVVEFLSANSIIAIHLSRLGEEWVR